MQIKLPTIDIKLRRPDISRVDLDKKRSSLQDLDLRGRASDLKDFAVERAGDLRDMASDRAGDLKDFATDRASDLRDLAADGAAGILTAASDGASSLRGIATEGASSLRDAASDSASGIRDRAPDVTLPEVHLPSVELPAVDIAKAVAPAAKAVSEGIGAVAQSFRSIGKGIDRWRHPRKPQPPLAETGIALLAGIGGGMALMFFLDPAKGRRRRSLLRAKLGRWSRVTAETFQSTKRDLANRSHAIAGAVPNIGRGDATPSDADTQTDVAASPDISGKLEEIDAVAGHQPEATTAAAQETPAWGASGTGIYGQTLGAPSSGQALADDSASTAEATVEEREGIASASES